MDKATKSILVELIGDYAAKRAAYAYQRTRATEYNTSNPSTELQKRKNLMIEAKATLDAFIENL